MLVLVLMFCMLSDRKREGRTLSTSTATATGSSGRRTRKTLEASNSVRKVKTGFGQFSEHFHPQENRACLLIWQPGCIGQGSQLEWSLSRSRCSQKSTDLNKFSDTIHFQKRCCYKLGIGRWAILKKYSANFHFELRWRRGRANWQTTANHQSLATSCGGEKLATQTELLLKI